MTDPSQLAAVHMLSHLISPSHITAPNVFCMIVCKMVQLSIAGGYNPSPPMPTRCMDSCSAG